MFAASCEVSAVCNQVEGLTLTVDMGRGSMAIAMRAMTKALRTSTRASVDMPSTAMTNATTYMIKTMNIIKADTMTNVTTDIIKTMDNIKVDMPTGTAKASIGMLTTEDMSSVTVDMDIGADVHELNSLSRGMTA